MISDIPKIIHYCWFGSEMPLNVQKNINGWREKCPDYQFILWNEKNFDINQFEYTQQAASVGKWAFVSDVARLVAVEKMGGYYLDTDVRLVKSLNRLDRLNIDCNCLFAMEFSGRVNTGIGFGATKNNEMIQRLIRMYSKTDYLNASGIPKHRTTVDIISDELHKYGLKNRDTIQFLNSKEIRGVLVLPTTFFVSQWFGKIRKNSRKFNDCIGIHELNASWYESGIMTSKIKPFLILTTMYIRRDLDFVFGYGSYNRLKKMIHKD